MNLGMLLSLGPSSLLLLLLLGVSLRLSYSLSLGAAVLDIGLVRIRKQIN